MELALSTYGAFEVDSGYAILLMRTHFSQDSTYACPMCMTKPCTPDMHRHGYPSFTARQAGSPATLLPAASARPRHLLKDPHKTPRSETFSTLRKFRGPDWPKNLK